MIETSSVDMVGLSAGTKNFIKYQFFKELKEYASSLVKKNNVSNLQFRKELALLIKAKNGNTKSKKIILSNFSKDIKYW